jgi:hypothetical protein
MDVRNKITVFAISAAFGFAVSLGITMAAWEPFEDRAFQCTDKMGGIFWCSIGTHQSAGDTILHGWTWERIRAVQACYVVGFITLWLSIAAAPALLPRKESHVQPT